MNDDYLTHLKNYWGVNHLYDKYGKQAVNDP